MDASAEKEWAAYREQLRSVRSGRRKEVAEDRAKRLAETPALPPQTRADVSLRCCGKKPLLYKRERVLCCIRCGAHYDMVTLSQIRPPYAKGEADDR
jgi:hypothetical protein